MKEGRGIPWRRGGAGLCLAVALVAAAWLCRAPRSVLVESQPSGAMVYLNGVCAGTTPLRVEGLALGPHVLALEMAGWAPYRQALDLASLAGGPWKRALGRLAGLTPVVTARLAPSGSATLVVTSLPAGAEAAVDDQAAGLTPLRLEGVAPGRKRVRFALNGYEPATVEVEAEAGTETVAHARLASKMVEILKARLEQDKDNLQDHVDLSHHYLVMGEHAQAAAALWEGFKVITEGRVKVIPGEDDKPEARFYHECWKTYTGQHYFPPEGSEVIRDACMEIMRKAAARDSKGYASKLLRQMEAHRRK